MALIRRADFFTARKKQLVYYSDFSADLNLLPGTGDLEALQNEDAVKNSIVNLMKTNRGERFFRPNLGSDIYRLLFENVTPTTSSTIEDFIRSTISEYEPRAKVLEVRVDADSEDNTVFVTIIFNILNKTDPVVLDVLLSRVR